MCGIFGAVFLDPAAAGASACRTIIKQLFLLSESRGKEASGFAFGDEHGLTMMRAPVPASKLLKSDQFKSVSASFIERFTSRESAHLSFIGHSRLVTDGERDTDINNQPVLKSRVVGVHNGIVVNHESLWESNSHLSRSSDLDSEVIFALIDDLLANGFSMPLAVAQIFGAIEGIANIAVLHKDSGALVLATNNGSVYLAASESLLIFASERYILQALSRYLPWLSGFATKHIEPANSVVIDTTTLKASEFNLFGEIPTFDCAPLQRDCAALAYAEPYRTPRTERNTIALDVIERRFPADLTLPEIKRCSKCVLPETMPFADFDPQGVCRYCRTNPPLETLGIPALERLIDEQPNTINGPDCVVGVSGGRDSLFGLHYLRTELGLNPYAFTYDWGMITDLARRNISRVCAKLGIEHVIVSADIPLKRLYIKKNVEAWLRRPQLGTIPLFMAGDKAYFYYLARAQRQTGANLAFMCENLLERTDFKTGFAGVPPEYNEHNVYTLSMFNKTKLLAYYGWQFLANPKYINSSLIDSAKAFSYYYLMPKGYFNLFRYVPWDETTVDSTLIDDYGFELAIDTQSTWRIGDGTTAFYNYIYHTMAGFTENDCFRSNQIRQGVITREDALTRVARENKPRFQSIQWYLETIGLGAKMLEVLEVINRAPKLYRT